MGFIDGFTCNIECIPTLSFLLFSLKLLTDVANVAISQQPGHFIIIFAF